jgi:hypothetical protein
MNRSRTNNANRIDMVVRVNDGRIPNQNDPVIWFPTGQNDITSVTHFQLFADLKPEKVSRIKNDIDDEHRKVNNFSLLLG